MSPHEKRRKASTRFVEASHSGDDYRAFIDASGAIHLAELSSGEAITIPAKAARPIIADLDNAREAQGYDEDRINAVHHFILARAFERSARPPR